MIPEEFMEVPELKEAVELTKESSYTKAELEAYDVYWDSIRSEKNLIADAEAKGERKKALQTAINLKQMGMLSNEQIADVTGLSLEEVENL